MRVGKREPADLASLVLGVGLGLTVAIFIQTLTASDLNGVYPIITTISRLCALVGTYLA